MQGEFLNSQEWLSLVFEGRNKKYGAYVHREESSDRHLKAMLIITLVAVGLIFLLKVIKSVLPVPNQGVSQNTGVTLTDLHPKQIDKDPVVPIGAPPSLVVLKTTTMFTPPVIVDDDRISDDELLKTQIELGESKGDISIATIVGDEEGIDIAFVKNYAPEIVEETSEPQVLIFAEEMPSFPGGEAELRKWLQDNIVYPTIALERGIQGRVSLRFVVTSDGTIDEVTVLKGLDPSCDKEAIRVVKKMPKWIPGKQNGNPAYVYFSLPVVFKINNN